MLSSPAMLRQLRPGEVAQSTPIVAPNAFDSAPINAPKVWVEPDAPRAHAISKTSPQASLPRSVWGTILAASGSLFASDTLTAKLAILGMRFGFAATDLTNKALRGERLNPTQRRLLEKNVEKELKLATRCAQRGHSETAHYHLFRAEESRLKLGAEMSPAERDLRSDLTNKELLRLREVIARVTSGPDVSSAHLALGGERQMQELVMQARRAGLSISDEALGAAAIARRLRPEIERLNLLRMEAAQPGTLARQAPTVDQRLEQLRAAHAIDPEANLGELTRAFRSAIDARMVDLNDVARSKNRFDAPRALKVLGEIDALEAEAAKLNLYFVHDFDKGHAERLRWFPEVRAIVNDLAGPAAGR